MKGVCLSLCAFLCLASCAEDAGPLVAANVRTYRLAGGDSADVARARAELERVLTRDGRLACGRGAAAWGRGRAGVGDSARARMCARLGYVRWRMRDTTGSLRAYRSALPYAHLQRDDSVRAVTIRDVAVVAAAAGDTATALAVLHDAERVALTHQLNDLAATVMRCAAALVEGHKGPLPCAEPTPKGSGKPLGLLVAAGVFGAFAYVVAWRLPKRRERRRRGYLYG